MRNYFGNEAGFQIENVIETTQWLWERGWAEANGGNISLRLTDLWKPKQKPDTFIDAKIPDGAENQIIFITGSGARLRHLFKSEELLMRSSAVILTKKEGYSILWGGKEGFKATSELSSHLLCHMIAAKGNERVLFHTHPHELIAISHHNVLGTDNKILNNELWATLPEVKLFLNRGCGLIPYTTPGTEELGLLTAKTLNEYDVALWRGHGAASIGENAELAFDKIDVANKGAKIWLFAKNASIDIKNE